MIYQIYQELKAEHPDKIVLIRVGDFYEAFEKDAEQIAESCNLYLSARVLTGHGKVPMAGFPYYSVMSYTRMIMADGKLCVLFDPSNPQDSAN